MKELLISSFFTLHSSLFIRPQGPPHQRQPGDTVAGGEVGRLDPAIFVVLPIQAKVGRGGVEQEGMYNPGPTLNRALDPDRSGARRELDRVADQPGLLADLGQGLLEWSHARLDESRDTVPAALSGGDRPAPLQQADLVAVAQEARHDGPFHELHVTLRATGLERRRREGPILPLQRCVVAARRVYLERTTVPMPDCGDAAVVGLA